MILEDIVNIFNSTSNIKIIISRNSDSVSTFCPGLKKQSISIIEWLPEQNAYLTKRNEFSLTAIDDLTKELEEKVVEYLFKESRDGV